SASDCSAMASARLLLEVAAEAEPHCRLDLLREVRLASRGETAIQRCAQDRCGNRLVDRRDDGPATFARVRHPTRELGELRALRQCAGGEVEKPRGDHATPP